MALNILPRLVRARNRLRDRWDDLLPHRTLEILSRPELERRFGLQRRVWDEFEAEFKSEVGLATRADAEFLFSFLEKVQPKRFLEIGTWRGGTAALIKTVCPKTEVITLNYPDPEVVNNPLKKSEIGSAFLRRQLDVKLVWADSADLPKLDLGRFDAIFVDGDHSYEAALRDLENCWARLNPQGYLMFHDYVQERGPAQPLHSKRVVRAFRKFAARHGAGIASGIHMEGSWIGAVQKGP
jgi:predicted O-methyltransferase YrrM